MASLRDMQNDNWLLRNLGCNIKSFDEGRGAYPIEGTNKILERTNEWGRGKRERVERENERVYFWS